MNFTKHFVLLCFASLAARSVLDAATITFGNIPYRGRSDSPFSQSIQNGTTYVEDFEDREANTPGLTLSNGRTFDSLGSSVDEDEGILNNVGLGRAWVVPGTALVPEGFPYTIGASFARDSSGHYPTHAGAVILGYTTLNIGDLRSFQAFDENGLPISESQLSFLTPVLSGTTPLYSTKGDRFFGLIYEGGISRIVLGGSLYYDHIQYGYGSIPEPTAGILAAGSIMAFILRRKRPVS